MARCAWSLENTSRTIARLMIWPAPALRPWIARKNSSTGRLGERAQPMEAAMNRMVPPMMTGLRPSASDSGPCSRLITAKDSR